MQTLILQLSSKGQILVGSASIQSGNDISGKDPGDCMEGLPCADADQQPGRQLSEALALGAASFCILYGAGLSQ